MKHIALFILLILSISLCTAQEEIDFKVNYLPNYNYISTQKQHIENLESENQKLT